MIFRKISVFAVLVLLVSFLTPAPSVYAAQTPSGIVFSELESQIDALINEHIGKSTPGGAVVVFHNGEIIFSKGYGHADIERGIPVDPAATIFEHGSISKLFVWTAAMQLVEQGLLDLDADISIYLPVDTVRKFAFEKPFTMRDLMNHAAGFEEVLLGLFSDARTMNEERGTLEEALLTIVPAQIFEPGTISAYSNWGTAFAALVVEYISGKSFSDFEMQNIFMPLGMANTLNQPDWIGNHAFLQNKARGYIADGNGGFDEGIWAYVPIYPAGAINGTAEDLARFAMAFAPAHGEPGPLFENADTLAAMLSPSSLDPINRPKTNHGFLRYAGALPNVGHGGNTETFSTNLVVVPEERFGFVVLTNAASETDIVYGITSLLLGEPEKVVPSANLPNASEVTGSFTMARRVESNITELFTFSVISITATDDNSIQQRSGLLEHCIFNR